MATLSLGDGDGKATAIPGPEGNAALLKLEELGLAYALYGHAEATTLEDQAARLKSAVTVFQIDEGASSQAVTVSGAPALPAARHAEPAIMATSVRVSPADTKAPESRILPATGARRAPPAGQRPATVLAVTQTRSAAPAPAAASADSAERDWETF